jgi:two-component system, OmpR family, sensor kinase
MNSLRIRLLVLLAGLILIGTLLQVGSTFRAAINEADELFDYQMRQIALSLRDADYGLPTDAEVASFPEGFDFVVQVWGRDGVRIYQSHRHSGLPDRAIIGFSVVDSPAGPWRVFAIQTPFRTIQIAQSLSIRRNLAINLAVRSVWPILPLALILLGGVWWVVSSSLSPIKRTTEELARQDANSLAPVDDRSLPAEVRPLVGGINALMQRVRQTLDDQQRFVGDAAHELRSPLTALKLQLQMLERAQDPAARTVGLSRLKLGVDRATHLVEQLLTLERQQAELRRASMPGGATANRPATGADAVSLRDIVDRAMIEIGPLAAARDIEVRIDVANDIRVAVEPQDLHTLIRNLLDNSIRYTPAGGQVQVVAGIDRDHCTFRIDDSGPGIPATDYERVFDRFYRRPGETATGSGLGLAIVKTIVERNRGSITLDRSPLGGLGAAIRFPAA